MEARGVADVKEGDVFEVELADVNVYSGTVTVGALRMLCRGSESDAGAAEAEIGEPRVVGL